MIEVVVGLMCVGCLVAGAVAGIPHGRKQALGEVFASAWARVEVLRARGRDAEADELAVFAACVATRIGRSKEVRP